MGATGPIVVVLAGPNGAGKSTAAPAVPRRPFDCFWRYCQIGKDLSCERMENDPPSRTTVMGPNPILVHSWPMAAPLIERFGAPPAKQF